MAIGERLKHAWNAFTNQEMFGTYDRGTSYGAGRPDRPRMTISNERSIIAAIYTRLSIDVASMVIRHVRLDEKGRYLEDMDSMLQNVLTVEANLDQAARAFRQDIAMTLFDKGVAAIVPIDTTEDPNKSASFDIKTARVGEVIEWMPRHVKVRVYNDATGRREDITMMKRSVAIVENPLYAVMNEPNSTLQRLIAKLNMLDAVDKQSSSGKLDIIVQVPYAMKSDLARQRAEQRRTDIEWQLKGSQYGIASIDGTEKITQLNRPSENNLLKQVEYLTAMLYGQLGLTEGIMNGTADEAAMLNYYNRTIDPVMTAITEAMKCKFLTKTARSQRQSIMYFKDLFKLIPLSDLAEIADKLTRNEIASSNEIRGFVGLQPSKDPKADQLRNSNMPQSELGQTAPSAQPTQEPNVPADNTSTAASGR